MGNITRGSRTGNNKKAGDQLGQPSKGKGARKTEGMKKMRNKKKETTRASRRGLYHASKAPRISLLLLFFFLQTHFLLPMVLQRMAKPLDDNEEHNNSK